MEIVRAELAGDPTVDITTYGRESGLPRRIEIWMLDVGGRFFITGTPGPRDWYANLGADPRIVVHLKLTAGIDVEGTAVPVHDDVTRRAVFDDPSARWYLEQGHDLEELVRSAPMVEVLL